MLNKETKRRIDNARDILVGQLPLPSDQIELITIALIYKFMDDIDEQSRELGGKPTFFVGDLRDLSWRKLISNTLSGEERVTKLIQGIEAISDAKHHSIPDLFKSIFKNAFLKFRDAQVLKLFLDEINGFTYDHSEELGNAFEYLLDTMGTQGQNGQFRTPRNIIEFIVDVVDPQKDETILDPACGTAGFLISAYKHILAANTSAKAAEKDPHAGDLLKSAAREKLTRNITGYDITPLMCRLSRVNMYLHHFANPVIHEYDTLTNKNRWGDKFDVILANPPFMTPTGGISTHDKFRIAAKRAEVLFADFILEHLNANGRAGFIVPEGIIFQNNDDYVSLRKWLINEAGLWAVVSLPANIFQPYSGVKTSILLVDRALARQRNDVLLVKVENDGFSLNTSRTPIKENDLPDALKLLQTAKQQDDPAAIGKLESKIQHRLVTRADFAKLDAYKATSTGWDFCRKFHVRAERLKKAAAEARATGDKSEVEKAEKALAKLPTEFSTATGLPKLPDTEAELRAAFDAKIKPEAACYGRNPSQPGKLTADLCEALDNQREFNLSFDRKHTASGVIRSGDYDWVEIGELCECINGRAFKPTDWEVRSPNALPIIRIQNLNNPNAELNYYSGPVAEKNLVEHGDLLFSWSGSKGTSFGAHIWHGSRAILNQHIFRIVHDERLDRGFFYWALKRVTEEVEQNLHGGVGLVHITKPKFEALKIPVPPLEEQRSIVAELEGYQCVVDGCDAVLERHRPSFTPEPDWPTIQIGDHTRLVSSGSTPLGGRANYSKEGVLFIRSQNVLAGKCDFSDAAFITPEMHKEMSRSQVKNGDVLLNITGASIGRCAVYLADAEANVNQHVCIIRLHKDKMIPEFLCAIINQPAFQDHIMRIQSGASRQALNFQQIRNFEVPCPNLETQRQFVVALQREQATLAGLEELKAKYEAKIAARLAAVWGEAGPETDSKAAEMIGS
jgi:type I restriction-modification system DNA methylase subunit/restriction endonuclease S subunit